MLDVLPERGREEVLTAARSRTYAHGEVLVRQGDEGSALFIVESGRVHARLMIASGSGVTLSVLGPGDVFGEMAMVMDAQERTATISAIGPVTAHVVQKRDVNRLREEHREVDDFLLQLLARRVEELSRRVLEAHHLPVEKRLARRLLDVGRLFADGSQPVVVHLTQEDIADLTGTTRPTVNQMLKKMDADGVLRLVRGRVELLDIAGLRARAR